MNRERTEKSAVPGASYTWTIPQNLKDAGCTDEMIQDFMELRASGEKEKQMNFLFRQRDLLLERIHREERKISRLDYLVYKIQRE